MTKLEVLDLIYGAIRGCGDLRIDDVTYDNDNDSGEIILTTDDEDSRLQTWVISSRDIRETDDEAQWRQCSRCGNKYDEAKGDGYCGLCPKCADETEPCGDCGMTPKNQGDITSIADHGRCIDCHKRWQHGECEDDLPDFLKMKPGEVRICKNCLKEIKDPTQFQVICKECDDEQRGRDLLDG